MKLNSIYLTDCIDGLKQLPDNSIDSIVTDPPYELGFMGKTWDSSGIAYNVNVWREALRVLKPGGYLLSFGGTRTYHRMACAIEDAGFEIRDQIQWLYGSGFPKSLDVSKAIDKLYGAEREVGPIDESRAGRLVNQKQDYVTDAGWSAGNRKITIDPPATEEAQQWNGWGTALKPANEPIVVARKPLEEKTVAKNVLKYGTGGINIDKCRIKIENGDTKQATAGKRTVENGKGWGINQSGCSYEKGTGAIFTNEGRWPANVIHDGSQKVANMFPKASFGNSNQPYVYAGKQYNNKQTSMFNGDKPQVPSSYGNSGSASRFFYKAEFSEEDFLPFYAAKASKKERGEGNNHPTVKPLKLIEYLVRLVTPPNGVCLDPFCGSGTTLLACKLQGFNYIGFDNDESSVETALRRLQ